MGIALVRRVANRFAQQDLPSRVAQRFAKQVEAAEIPNENTEVSVQLLGEVADNSKLK